MNERSKTKQAAAAPLTAPNLSAEPISAAPIHTSSIQAPLGETAPGGERAGLTLGVFDSGFGGLTVLRDRKSVV